MCETIVFYTLQCLFVISMILLGIGLALLNGNIGSSLECPTDYILCENNFISNINIFQKFND